MDTATHPVEGLSTMTATRIDLGTVRAALALTARAPSVHNSQPWRWRVRDGVVDLYADLTRWLPLTDTDGRDLVVSCGAALHHLQVALRGLDVAYTVDRMPDPERPDLLASIHLGLTDIGHPAEKESVLDAASAIMKRRTDRRRYTDWPVPPEHLADLAARAAERGALLRVVPEGPALRTLALAIQTAAMEHAAVPGYDTELSLWSGLQSSDDGVPADAVPVAGEARPGVPPRRYASAAMPEGSSPADGATLLVLGTSSDDRLSQLRAGEAMSAVLLRATTFGLATSPLSEPLELAGTRVLVRDQVLDGTLSPQIVLRVGWAPVGEAVPESPRRPLADQVEGLEEP
jgi:nitroreductase